MDAVGNLYVADGGNARVQEYNGSTWSVISTGLPTAHGQPGKFYAPSGAGVLNGNLYVADYDTGGDSYASPDVQEYVPGTGWSIVGTGSFPGYSKPDAVAGLSNGTILVLTYGDNIIFKENSSTWTSFGSLSFGPYPQGIAADANGYVFVSNTGNSNVQVLDSNGKNVVSFGSGTLNNPYGIAVDNLGSVYVADYGNRRIAVFKNAP